MIPHIRAVDPSRILLSLVLVTALSCAPKASGTTPALPNMPTAKAKTSTSAIDHLHDFEFGPMRFSRWRLGNGLEVVLGPDPLAHAACYMTWYRVGSRDENAAAGETGLAHLFEHLMFTQTKSQSEGEFDRRMDAIGAEINAMTDNDFTAYVDVMPPQELELAISLESDRMINLALSKKQVETEREVVSEERLQTVEDDVDGTLHERILDRAYAKHPYRWPVIGRMEDIKAVTQKKALAFYKTYYAPNNAVVIVTGRFDAQTVLDAIVKHYGPIPAAETPTNTPAVEHAPVAPARIEIEGPVPADRVALAFAAPGMGDPSRPAFELLNELLTGGPSSRLHHSLVIQSEMASSVSGQVGSTRDPGLYLLWVQMRRARASSDAEKAVLASLKSLAEKEPSADELEGARNRIRTQFWAGLTSSQGRAEQLGFFEIGTGDYRNLFTRNEAYNKVTAADITRLAQSHLLQHPHIVAITHPLPGAENSASDDQP